MAKTKNEQLEQETAIALARANGNIALAARILDEKRTTVQRRVERSKMLSDLRGELENELLDIAEGQLAAKVKKGDMRAIVFYLRTKGRRRGYVFRDEIVPPDPEGGGSGPMVIPGVATEAGWEDEFQAAIERRE